MTEQPPPPVTLEILVCPADVGYAKESMRHQLRALGGQVQEVLFAVDLLAPKGGRYADGWGDALPELERLLGDLCREHPNSRVVYARGEPEQLDRLGARFFGGRKIPPKDCRGSAFEVYWLAFDSASNDYIMHVDSDMLFGGGSQVWVAEAVRLLESDPDAISVIPLSGPPRSDGRLLDQEVTHGSYPWPTPAWRVDVWTTRVALFDRRRLLERLTPLPLSRPPLRRSWIKAGFNRNPLVAMPEDLIKAAAARAGMYRVDLLGGDRGMWSLHPALKPPEYFEQLGAIIARVEAGDVPDEQLGRYDIVDELVDQSAMRRSRRLTPWR